MKPATKSLLLNFFSRLAALGVLLYAPIIVLALLIGQGTPRQAILFVSNRDGTNKLYRIDIAHNITRKLNDQPVIACCPVWSGDGSHIAFLSVDESAAKIYLIDADGGHLHRLTGEKSTNEGSPVWSPDGKEIAFVFVSLLTARSGIFITDVDSGGTRPLTEEFANDFSPVWSPDGSRILFASDLSINGTSRLEDAELFDIQPDGKDRRQITNDPAHDSAAAYSPDGKYIVFTTTPPDYFPISIYRMDADGSHQVLITDQDVSRNTAPVWAPDSQQVLFLSHRDGDVELFNADSDGRNVRQLTANASQDWLPAWSPDGSQILFLSLRDGDSAVYLMDADGAHARRLTPYPSADTFASWQPGS
jgi:TolB protein